MPILQYECLTCHKKFEELVKSHLDEVNCPDCGGKTKRDYSGRIYTATGQQSSACSGDCKNCKGCKK